MAKSYYRMIDGNRYDREMLELAEEAVAGKGDGRISVEDAKKLYEAIIDGNTITEIEQATLDYIKENFHFTDAALKWLDEELAHWTLAKQPQQPVVKSPPRPSKKPSVKKVTVQAPGPGRAFTIVCAASAIVFLLLVPVAYFMGKNGTQNGGDSTPQVNIEALETSLRSKNQELISLKTENKDLTSRIAEIEAKQAAVSIQAEESLEPTEHTVLKIRKRLAAELEKGLDGGIANPMIRLDKENLELIFFSGTGAALTPNFAKRLDEYFPRLIQILHDYDQNIAAIRFQGHSSSDWKSAKSKTDAYLKNMGLSMARAESALRYCLNMDRVKQHREWMIKRLVSSGFSYSKLILDQSGREDPIHSRRVSIAIEISGDRQGAEQ